MGSQLGSTLDNVFMCHFQNIWLENCPTQFTPVVHKTYLDDTFLLFCSTEHIEKFKKCLKKQHKDIALPSEIKQNSWLSFLDIKIERATSFFASVYRKTTFSGAFTNSESIISKSYKRTLIDTLLNKRFRKNHRKTLVWRLFRLATLLKSDSNTVVFLWILKKFQGHLFCKTSANGCFWTLLM